MVFLNKTMLGTIYVYTNRDSMDGKDLTCEENLLVLDYSS